MSDLQTRLYMHDGKMTIGTFQDCTAIHENAKKLHREGNHGSAEFKHAARLPLFAVENYCNVSNITFDEFMGNPVHMKRMLNDPDLRDFRIWPGTV